MVLAGINSGAYKVVFLLHIVAVIVGFGGVVLNGLYGMQAKRRPGPGGQAVGEANLAVTKVAELFIYTVPIWGFALLGMSDKVWKVSQTWVWLSLLLYLVGVAVSHAVLLKNAKQMNALMAELNSGGARPDVGGPPPQVAELERLGQQQGMVGGSLNLLLVVILILMIWKPGA